MNIEFRTSIWKASFRPSTFAVEIETSLRQMFGLANRYDAARLCIGRSLNEARDSLLDITPPKDFGKPIPGEHLFGDQIDVWICLLVQQGKLGLTATVDNFRQLVEMHWNRGAELISEDVNSVNGDESRLLILLADLLPTHGDTSTGQPKLSTSYGEVKLRVGPISETFPGGKPVEFTMNGQGTSPNIALMGKMGSGKTRTGFDVMKQIVSQQSIPILLIDPKGDFTDGSYAQELSEAVPGIQTILVGQKPIPIDFLPQPDSGSAAIQNAAMLLRDSVALCCKGAGDIQKSLLRSTILKVIEDNAMRDLETILEYYEKELVSEGKKHDSIMSRLKEMTDMKCFSPEYKPYQFFSRSWVIGLQHIQSDELKRLVILLLLDSYRAYVLPQPDAPVESGFRGLRQLLFIDEARRILAQKKYESLVDIIRQGRAKGIVTILISQDPSDFHGQADDFTTQLGSVISFACNQSTTGLQALQGVFGRKLQSAEFSDTYLTTGVAFAKLPNREPERIRCWIP